MVGRLTVLYMFGKMNGELDSNLRFMHSLIRYNWSNPFSIFAYAEKGQASFLVEVKSRLKQMFSRSKVRPRTKIEVQDVLKCHPLETYCY